MTDPNLNVDQRSSSLPGSGVTTPGSFASRRSRTPLSLDLSNIPPLAQPSPPSNTLLLTNLVDPDIFHPATLEEIRKLISENAELHSFSPLKSLRRIIVSFYDTADAIRIRQLIDGETIVNSRVRIYFGEPTPIKSVDQHLAAPKLEKLFFISPPPSPPLGWEMHNEGPPSKEIHADDLVSALAKLQARHAAEADLNLDSPTDVDTEGGRRRSPSSTLLYCPEASGDSPRLPTVTVEDIGDSPESAGLIDSSKETRILAHTARPPVELMHEA